MLSATHIHVTTCMYTAYMGLGNRRTLNSCRKLYPQKPLLFKLVLQSKFSTPINPYRHDSQYNLYISFRVWIDASSIFNKKINRVFFSNMSVEKNYFLVDTNAENLTLCL